MSLVSQLQLALTRIGQEIKAKASRLTAPMSTVSANLLVNGTFTGSASGWTLGGGAVYAANGVSMVDGATVAQTVTVTNGTIYNVVAQLPAPSGYLAISLGADASVLDTHQWTGGTSIKTNNGGGSLVLLLTSVGAVGVLDNVVLQAMTSTAAETVGGIELRNSKGSGFAIGGGAMASMIDDWPMTSVAIGNGAMAESTYGGQNLSVGYQAGFCVNGYSNTAIGSAALNGAYPTRSGFNQTAIGANAGQATDEPSNGITVVGSSAEAAGLGAVAVGMHATAAFAESVALGKDATTTTTSQVAFGLRHLELIEIVAPPAGAGNAARIYAINQAGLTQLMVQFATGVAVPIVAEGGAVSSDGSVMKVVFMTAAAYAAITTPDAKTVYMIAA